MTDFQQNHLLPASRALLCWSNPLLSLLAGDSAKDLTMTALGLDSLKAPPDWPPDWCGVGLARVGLACEAV